MVTPGSAGLRGGQRLRQNELGASLVEYALLLLFIAVVVVIVVGQLGESASTSFESAIDGFPN